MIEFATRRPLPLKNRGLSTRVFSWLTAPLLVAISLSATTAQAQDATWSPGTSDFNTDANWTPATTPTGTASFGGAGTTSLTLSTGTTIDTFQFNPGAPAYTFDLNGHFLEFTGNGIVNNSANAPTINAFGLLQFDNTATAGNAIINNTPGATTFTGFSTAGTATITNSGGGLLSFTDSSNAGSATITTNAGSLTQFAANSDGGNARFVTNAGGTVDFSGTVGFDGFNIVNTGSIAGAGQYFLGNNIVHVGGNGDTTVVSGVISACGPTGNECSAASGTSGGALFKDGAGTLTLTGVNTYTSATVVNGGKLLLGGAGTLGATTAQLQVFAGILDLGGTAQTTGAMSMFGGSLINGALNSATYELGAGFISASLTGPGAVTLDGTGATTLAAANTYSGGTIFLSGTLIIGNSNALSSGNLSMAAGTTLSFDTAAAYNVANNISIAGDPIFNVAAGPAQTVSGIISDTDPIDNPGIVEKTGAGTLILSGANTYSGGTVLSQGTLQIGVNSTFTNINDPSTQTSSAIGLGKLTFDGGTLKASTSADRRFGNAVEITANGGTVDDAGGFIRLLGGISDAASSSGGTLTLMSSLPGGFLEGILLGGVNTYSGATNITSGHVTAQSTTALSPNSAFQVNTGATLTLSGFNNTIASLADGAGGGGIVENAAASGTATLTINGASGVTTSFSGVLQDGGGGEGGGGGPKLALIKDGASTQILAGTNTYTGGTTIGGGVLQLGNSAVNSGTTGSIVGNVTNNATLAFNRSNAYQFDGVISGSGAVAQNGIGTTTLTAVNIYSGATTINAGTLALSGTGSIAASSGVTDNGTFDISSTTAGASIKNLSGAGIVTLGNQTLTLTDASGTFSGAIGGSGGLTKQGTGLFILSGTSTYSGPTMVTDGNLRVNGSIASAVTVQSGATLSGIGTVGGAVTIQSGGFLSAGQSPGTLNVGALSLNAGSTSIFELGTPGVAGGATNDLVNVIGNLTLGGTLSVNAPSAGYYRLFNYGTLTPSSFDTISGSTNGTPTVLTNVPNQVNLSIMAAGQQLQFWDGADQVGNGVVNGGTGTWNAANTNWTGAPGNANINDQWRSSVGVFAGTAGTVTIAGTQAFDTLQFSTTGYVLNAGAGGQLQLAGLSGTGTINTDNGVVTTLNTPLVNGSSQSLTKVGGGTLILTAANSYSGGTTISGGTLQLGNGGITGSITGNVINNGFFAINRSDAFTFGGTVSGTGAFRQLGTGTTILTADNNYGGGTTISAGTLQLGNGGTAGSVTGNVVNNSVLTINRSNALALGGVISGTGALNQIGAGTTTLSGANIYTGPTTISNGTLTVAATGSITSNVTNNATFANAGTVTGSLTNTGTASNSATITGGLTNTAGTTTNTGTIGGGATVTGGTLNTIAATSIINGGLTNSATVNAQNQVNGAIVNQGAGTFNVAGNLVGNSSFTNNGTAQLLVNGGNFTGITTLTNNSTNATGINVAATRTLSTTGTASNAAGANIAVSGTFTVGQLLTNAGVILVNSGGTVNATVGGITNTATGTITVALGGTVNDDLNNAGAINNNGVYNAIVATNTGAITNSATGVWTGNVLSNAAAIVNSVAWTGNVVSNTGTLTNNLTWTGTIANAGTFTNNAGATVSGLLTNTGGIATNNGALNGGATLSGGTLTGIGAVANLMVLNGGTFAPGNGTPGTSMTITGNLAFQSGALYLVQLNPATSTFADVKGTAALNGGAGAAFLAGNYVAKKYTILTAAGGVSGTFGSFNTVGIPSGFKASLSYDAKNVFLDLALGFAGPGFGSGLNVNQQNVANALTNFFNANGGIPAVFGGLTPSGLTIASGELGTGVIQSSIKADDLFLNLLLDPAVAGRAGGFGPVAGPSQFAADDEALAYEAKRRASPGERAAYAMATKAPNLLAAQAANRWSVWGAAYGGSGTTDGNAVVGSHNTTARAYGIAVGADYKVSPNTLLGFALAGGGTGFSLADGLGSGSADLFQAGAFARHNFGSAYLSGALAYGWHDVTTNRTVAMVGDRLHARFKAETFSGRFEGGYRFATPMIGVTPYVAAQAISFNLPAYAEQALAGGGLFALNYASQTTTATRTELGLRTDRSFAMQDAMLTLRGRAAWAHDYNTDRSVTAIFQALPGANFVVNGARGYPDGALVGAGAEMKWLNGFSLAATFEGEFSGNTTSYSGKGVARYTW